ncbi:hypothetical protein ACFFX0_12205 [Citricoccus parietis]|uniref:Uncharacterized protein n=1 Tax=Citricoccus parietis TaxID=592307 RepID=A0ABV5FZ09_9MICC
MDLDLAGDSTMTSFVPSPEEVVFLDVFSDTRAPFRRRAGNRSTGPGWPNGWPPVTSRRTARCPTNVTAPRPRSSTVGAPRAPDQA